MEELPTKNFSGWNIKEKLFSGVVTVTVGIIITINTWNF